jgi:hypothetical protein
MIYKYAGELNCLPSFFDDKKGKGHDINSGFWKIKGQSSNPFHRCEHHTIPLLSVYIGFVTGIKNKHRFNYP